MPSHPFYGKGEGKGEGHVHCPIDSSAYQRKALISHKAKKADDDHIDKTIKKRQGRNKEAENPLKIPTSLAHQKQWEYKSTNRWDYRGGDVTQCDRRRAEKGHALFERAAVKQL